MLTFKELESAHVAVQLAMRQAITDKRPITPGSLTQLAYSFGRSITEKSHIDIYLQCVNVEKLNYFIEEAIPLREAGKE